MVPQVRPIICESAPASAARPGDKWHLDEVLRTLNKERHYLWRAVDQDGHVLDILVQHRRDKHAAKKLFRKLLKELTCAPRVIITDKLKSYGAAKREILPGVEHRQHRYLNNRAENSHQPTHQRERRMQGFKSPGHAQHFLAAYGPMAQHFRPRRYRVSASAYRQEMQQRFQMWGEITGMGVAA
jgi:putative transposase